MSKIKLGKYPYTYARVSYMKAALLKKSDYDKLQKMSLSEVINFISESGYRKEIDEFAVKYNGVDLMEYSLTRNMANSFNKLKKISSKGLRQLLDAYLLRNDVWNLKTILRSKFTGEDPQETENLLIPCGDISLDNLKEMIEKDSIEDVWRMIPNLDKKEIEHGIREYTESKNLSFMENTLEKKYYDFISNFANRLPKKGKTFRDFLYVEIEILNLLNIIRMKRANVPTENISKYIIPISEKEDLALQSFIIANNETDISKFFIKREYGKVLQAGLEEYKKSGSLITLEKSLQKHLLEKTTQMPKKHPLSVDVILGYMFAKEIEIRNLRTILRAKQFEMSDEFVEKSLVIANV